MTTFLRQLLQVLDVPFTRDYTDTYFRTHPNKSNLLGLCQMLDHFKVSNMALRIDSDDLKKIPLPFVVSYSGDFAIVRHIEEEKVFFDFREVSYDLTIKEFEKGWKGVVLHMEKDQSSGEPDFLIHRKRDLIINVFRGSVFLLLAVWLGQQLHSSVELNKSNLIFVVGHFLCNGMGLALCLLLLFKQLNRSNRLADRVCTMIKGNDCSHVLSSEAASFMGIFSWSEIGTSFFISNLIVLLFFPQLLNWYALINIFCLPFTIWSVWYQWRVLRQWCVLCLLVQTLLWSIFALNFVGGFIEWPLFSFSTLLQVGVILLVPLFFVLFLTHLHSRLEKSVSNEQELGSLKADDRVFFALLKQEAYYNTENVTRLIRGNPDARIKITVLSNPFCKPCSRMHKRLNALMHDIGEHICVQYILSSFNEDLEEVNYQLVAAYLQSDNEDPFSIFDMWFHNPEKSFFNDFSIDITHPAVHDEIARYNQWKIETSLQATPTILINGYTLPKSFQVEDIRYFAGNVVDDIPIVGSA